ncbi:MAG: hypothetical protein IKC71_02920 [Clostridia bacterium]|nr:hypothetical protein [Clostridia bacterium]
MKKSIVLFAFIAVITLIASIGGTFATWYFAEEPPTPVMKSEDIGISEFEYKPFQGVYIDSIIVYDFKNVTERATEFTKPTDIYSSVRAVAGSYITYKVTFHNNSSVNHWFVKKSFTNSLVQNSLVDKQNGVTITLKDHPGDNYSTFNNEDWIPANTYRDVYITYTFGSNAINEVTTFVSYIFGEKMDAVYTNFVDILNNQETYSFLAKAFDDKYSATGEVVIANLGKEKEIFDTLFGGDVTINVDGQDVPVTIMIRRENVDGKNTGDAYANGPTGCEYTLYITIDELDANNNPTGKATVFAVTYSEGGISNQDKWYQVGELYEGTSSLDGYLGEDAFDYTTWEAVPKEYIVADGITYKIGLEQGDQYQKMKKLEEIMAVRDNEIFNKINNTQILKKVYAIIHNAQNKGKPGYDILKQAFEDASPFYTVNNNGGDIPVNTNCTRAEILPYIEAIQKALDYYNQVN